jgi:hypothetical protein
VSSGLNPKKTEKSRPSFPAAAAAASSSHVRVAPPPRLQSKEEIQAEVKAQLKRYGSRRCLFFTIRVP